MGEAICFRFGQGKERFQDKELVIFPDASEVKDRYWTVAKSTICHGAEEIHPERQSLAIDGRLRAVPEDRKTYSIFSSSSASPKSKSQISYSATRK